MNLISNFFWCIIGIIGGAIVTVINNKRKRLTRKIVTVPLISKKASTIKGLEIKYDSCSIKNLFSSTIQIKNTGNTTINNTDIPKKFPFSIHTNGIFITDKLNIQPPDINNENDIHINFIESSDGISSDAIIDFEFISPKQLISFSLLHTGKISLGKWIIKEGKVLESNEILDEAESLRSISQKSVLIACIITIIISCISSYISTMNLQNLHSIQSKFLNLQEKNQELEDNVYKLQQKNQELIQKQK